MSFLRTFQLPLASAICVLGLGFMASQAPAQDSFFEGPSSSSTDINSGFPSAEGRDDLLNSPTGLLDLIHRANRLSGQSDDEFRSRQSRQIQEAAVDFKQAQQERLRLEAEAETPGVDVE